LDSLPLGYRAKTETFSRQVAAPLGEGARTQVASSW